jgi:hypothetical protein
MAIIVRTDLHCGNKVRHQDQRPAVAVVNDPVVGGPRNWFLRCAECVEALRRPNDEPYLVAYLHGHDPAAGVGWPTRSDDHGDASDQPIPDHD